MPRSRTGTRWELPRSPNSGAGRLSVRRKSMRCRTNLPGRSMPRCRTGSRCKLPSSAHCGAGGLSMRTKAMQCRTSVSGFKCRQLPGSRRAAARSHGPRPQLRPLFGSLQQSGKHFVLNRGVSGFRFSVSDIRLFCFRFSEYQFKKKGKTRRNSEN